MEMERSVNTDFHLCVCMIVLYECIDSLPQSVIMYLFITGTYRPTAAVEGTE